ncbi:hypothetical protein B0H13DRAFT_1592038 [Mycena leptocephala]|nr:hypothetical protein B0H13DRAFT_1592038 [Mycena leptocephala]
MLHCKEFSAWVSIEGKVTEEYGVEISEDQKSVTCWIPSELGKKFSVQWKNESYYHDTRGRVKMDGNYCGGKVIYARKIPKSTFLAGVSDGATLKPFIFSSLELTGEF